MSNIDPSFNLLSLAIQSFLEHEAATIAADVSLRLCLRSGDHLLESKLKEFSNGYCFNKIRCQFRYWTSSVILLRVPFRLSRPCFGNPPSPTARAAWSRIRSLPLELASKIIDEAYNQCFSADSRVALTTLAVALEAARAVSVEFAARTGNTRACHFAPAAPHSWTYLGLLMPSSVVRIDLSYTNVENSFLAAISRSDAARKIKKLKLRRSNVTIDGLHHLEALVHLEALDVAQISFPAGAATLLAAVSPRLRSLSMGKSDSIAIRSVF